MQTAKMIPGCVHFELLFLPSPASFHLFFGTPSPAGTCHALMLMLEDPAAFLLCHAPEDNNNGRPPKQPVPTLQGRAAVQAQLQVGSGSRVQAGACWHLVAVWDTGAAPLMSLWCSDADAGRSSCVVPCTAIQQERRQDTLQCQSSLPQHCRAMRLSSGAAGGCCLLLFKDAQSPLCPSLAGLFKTDPGYSHVSAVQRCVLAPSSRQQRKGQAHLYSQGQSFRKPCGYPDCLYFKPSCVLCSPCNTKVSKGLACAACFLPLISELKSLTQQDWLPCTPVPSLQFSGETGLQPCACCQATQACPLQLHPGIARVAKATGTAGVQR